MDLGKDAKNLSLGSFVDNQGGIQSIVKDLKSEISVEDKVVSLELELKEKYDYAVKRYLNGRQGSEQKHLENFQKVQKQVEQWSKEKTKKVSATPISKEERKSLQKMYEFFSTLLDEKTKLMDGLDAIKKLEDGQLSAQRQTSRPSLEEIKSSLRTINWLQDKIRLTKQGGKGMKMFKNDWGGWSQNPYKHFFKDEDSYRKAISVLNSSVATIEKAKRQLVSDRAMWGWWRATNHFDLQEKQLNEASANVGSHIELQVAQSLLENMNILKTKGQ